MKNEKKQDEQLIKEKAEAYDQAVALAQAEMLKSSTDYNGRNLIKKLFPVLEKSDEDTVDDIIRFFKSCAAGVTQVTKTGDFIAWYDFLTKWKYTATENKDLEMLSSIINDVLQDDLLDEEQISWLKKRFAILLIKADKGDGIPYKRLSDEIESVSKRYPEVSYAKLTRIAFHFAKWGRYGTRWTDEDVANTNAAIEYFRKLRDKNEIDLPLPGIGMVTPGMLAGIVCTLNKITALGSFE